MNEPYRIWKEHTSITIELSRAHTPCAHEFDAIVVVVAVMQSNDFTILTYNMFSSSMPMRK